MAKISEILVRAAADMDTENTGYIPFYIKDCLCMHSPHDMAANYKAHDFYLEYALEYEKEFLETRSKISVLFLCMLAAIAESEGNL